MRRFALLALLGVAACAHAPPRSSAAPSSAPSSAFALTESALAPIAIDGDDGSKLTIEDLHIDVRIHGPLAYTEIHGLFRNPTPNRMEGRFRLALPPRSSLARLAMRIGGVMREAEAAETDAARATYEEILHRRRDPLLVEQPREREVAARVAPIEGHEQKEILVAYTSEIGPDHPVIVPLRGLPEIRRGEVAIHDGPTELFRQEFADTLPVADVRYAPPSASELRERDVVATRIQAPLSTEPEPLDHVVYLVDTSASADVTAAAALLEHVLPRAPIVAYDQTAEPIARPSDLRARGALGLANLDAAFARAKELNAKRVVVLGGGSFEGASPAGRPSAAPSFDRIDVLALVPTNDGRTLRRLVTNGLFLEDAATANSERLLQRLGHRVQQEPIRIPNASWQSAKTLPSGEERVVFAQIGAAPASSATEGLAQNSLAHAFAAAKLDDLVLRGEKKEAIALARAHRLASPYTSLIVLETNNDVASLRSKEGKPPPAGPLAAAPASGPSTGRGTTHTAKTPMLRMASVTVNGRVPPEVIQRIVRLNFGMMRACYQDGLRRNPKLEGRVIVRFVIGRDGRVARAVDGGSEIKDAKAIACVVEAFSRLEFPQPEGGIVTVAYPIVFGAEEIPTPELHVPQKPRSSWMTLQDPSGPPPSPPSPWSVDFLQMRATPDLAPRTPFGFVARGEAYEAKGDLANAARAYASLAELWPERSELLRAAAVRLDKMHPGDPLAVTLLRRAVAARPDQPSGHHLLGLTLLRAGDKDGARAAFEAGLTRRYELRYAGVSDLFTQDLMLLESDTTLVRRVSLVWETDTSYVGVTPSTGYALAQPMDGFGPALYQVTAAGPIGVSVYRRGMGGDVLGAVHVIERNERGDVTVEPRPFEVMTEGATLDLGAL